MRVRPILVLALATVAVAAPAVGAAAPSGTYKGTATTAGVKAQKVGASIEKRSCPTGTGKFKQALCLIWSPGFTTKLKCKVWNDADPTKKDSTEGRSIPYLIGGVSSSGAISYTEKKTGPGYSETMTVTASAKKGKLTGKVSYVSKGRSSVISKDCSGSTSFSLKQS